jgi:pimeloyl-ACP methyl ester carboxylesterase
MAKSAIRQNLTNEIEKIKTVTLLIWGENDIITPPFVAHQFNEKLKNSSLFFIPNCGHAPMMEYPKRFAEILFPFLDKIYLKNE